jgi:REP element-mobilizing transposase RayT
MGARMTAPRQVLAGTTYLVTRRCFQRQLLLRPCPQTNQIFLYLLAVAARRSGVRVHAFCVLSNHFHLVVTDPDARLPAFEQYLDSLVARAVNASLGRWESFWAPSSYSAVALLAPDDIIDKTAYTLANPVAAGLVRRGQDWPGLWSDPEQVGSSLTVPRPDAFFRKDGPMPESVDLELTAPPGFGSPADFRDRVAAALHLHEERAAVALASQGRELLGPDQVLRQTPTDRPATDEPRGQLSPRIACRDKWKRIEALSRLKDFLASYRAAWTAMTKGARDVLFPNGTYWVRVMLGARCAGLDGPGPALAPG